MTLVQKIPGCRMNCFNQLRSAVGPTGMSLALLLLTVACQKMPSGQDVAATPFLETHPEIQVHAFREGRGRARWDFTFPAELQERLAAAKFNLTIRQLGQAEKERQAAAGAALLRDLRAAVARGERRFAIPPGNYRLAIGPEYGNDQNRPASFVRLENLQDMEIDGQGATIWFTGDTRPHGLFFANCERIVLRNLNLDYDPLPFLQGEAVAVNEDNPAVTIRLDPGFAASVDLLDVERSRRPMHYHAFQADPATGRRINPQWVAGHNTSASFTRRPRAPGIPRQRTPRPTSTTPLPWSTMSRSRSAATGSNSQGHISGRPSWSWFRKTIHKRHRPRSSPLGFADRCSQGGSHPRSAGKQSGARAAFCELRRGTARAQPFVNSVTYVLVVLILAVSAIVPQPADDGGSSIKKHRNIIQRFISCV